MDKAKEAAAQQVSQRVNSTPPPTSSGRCPQPGPHYVTDVNKGSINMGRWQATLNDRFAQGYRLAHVIEQDGNTVQVFEHRHP